MSIVNSGKLPRYGSELKPRVVETMGYGLDNFISDPIFRSEIQIHFFESGNVENAGADMIEKTFDLMVSVVKTLLEAAQACTTWPRLQTFVEETWMYKMEEAKLAAQAHLETTLLAEKAQIWTLNPSYMETIAAVKAEAKIIRDEETLKCTDIEARKEATEELEERLGVGEGFIENYARAENSDQALLELQLSLHCYANVVMARLFDSIPIAIRHLLVYEPHASFSEIMHGCSDSDLERAMSEDPASAKSRARLERSKIRLDKALQKLASFH